MSLYETWVMQEKPDANVNCGIMTALVRENWDEENKGMVKVEFFFGEEGKTKTRWVPVASPYACDKAGLFFSPEVGSEVLVAFINGNRNEPVVIGGVWNSKTPMGDDFAVENNTVKTIRTKAGHEIRFDETEEKGQITIQTVGQLKIQLEDEKKTLIITDSGGKTGLMMDFENGKVAVLADKEIVLSAGDKEIIKLAGDSAVVKADTVKAEAVQALGLKGQNINLKSDAALEVKAGATLKLEGSAMAEIKGGMVKIN